MNHANNFRQHFTDEDIVQFDRRSPRALESAVKIVAGIGVPVAIILGWPLAELVSSLRDAWNKIPHFVPSSIAAMAVTLVFGTTLVGLTAWLGIERSRTDGKGEEFVTTRLVAIILIVGIPVVAIASGAAVFALS